MRIFKVLLTKVESNHNNLRTNEIEGATLALPEIGKGFDMSGEPLDPAMAVRVINTTEIKELEQNGDEFTFKTLNSTYKLKVLGTEDIE